MKVLDLQCSQGHSFEGWFGSQDDYDAQRARGLVTCPVCNDSEIVKLLSAPRLNLGHGTAPEPSRSSTPAMPTSAGTGLAKAELPGADTGAPGAHGMTLPVDSSTLHQMQATLLNMMRQVMANTEDVGSQFAEEARKIHYGESEERNIRGQATREEAEALLEEGIEVMALAVPESLKGPLQ